MFQQQQPPAARPDLAKLIDHVSSTRDEVAASALRPFFYAFMAMIGGLILAVCIGLAMRSLSVFRNAVIIDLEIGGLIMLWLLFREHEVSMAERWARVSLIDAVREIITGEDRNQDGVIGFPQRTWISNNTGAPPQRMAEPDKFTQFVHDAWIHGTPEATVLDQVTGQTLKAKYGDDYERFRDNLIKWRYAEWLNPGAHTLGWQFVVHYDQINERVHVDEE